MKTYTLFLLLILLGLSGSASLLTGQVKQLSIAGTYEKKTYQVPRIDRKIKVDGVLDAEEWRDALTLPLNFEFAPGYNVAAPVKTDVMFMYSKTHVYVAFRAFDPNPKEIRARLCDRDGFGGDDWVAVLFDTFNDQRGTFNFCSNPLGIQADMVETISGGGHEWDAIWDSAGKLNNEGYCVEIAIPFTSLRFQMSEGDQVWSFDAMRCYPRSRNHQISVFPHDRNNSCLMCQAPKLQGFAGTRPGLDIELDPTIAVRFSGKRPTGYGDFENSTKADPGLTARWNITPNLTLNGTINPDFSNVEADIPQLDVNNQFSLDYPEKRPFFVEGFNWFKTPLRAVHTRTVVDPDWGIKLTGKIGRSDIGFFSAYDRTPSLTIPGNYNSETYSLAATRKYPAIRTYDSVLRLRQDIGSSSTIGLLFTDREGDGYYNRLGGVDGDIAITRRDRVKFQLMGAQTRYNDTMVKRFRLPSGSFSDGAFRAVYNHRTNTVNWYFLYENVGAKFRADLGFMPQVDYQHFQPGISYIWRHRKGSWFSMIELGGRVEIQNDHTGFLQNRDAVVWLNYDGPMQTFVNLVGRVGKSSYLYKKFDEAKLNFAVGIRPNRFNIQLTGLVGDQIDVMNAESGKVLRLQPTIEWQIRPHLTINFGHQYERLNVPRGRLYDANITDVKIVYQFTRNMFFRAMVQYMNHKFNVPLFYVPMEPRFRHFFTQFLLSYKINPRTVCFIGYTDDYAGFLNNNYVIRQTNRTVFMKIGYALVL